MRVFAVAFALLGSVLAAPPAALAAQATSTSAAMSDMDRLLAPIALYPDALLAQMLLCASNTTAVVRFHMWLGSNTTLKGSALQDAATVAGFDPSFVALAIFPQVIKQMAEDPDWTTRLGKAFAADKTAVFASIQKLRAQAASVGTLKDTPQQNVETKTTSNGQQVIVIEPANPQVVYVPQYNPTVVYTTQPTSTTVVVQKEDDDDDEALAALIGFGAGIALGAAMDNDYYYGPYGWRGGGYMYNDAWDDFYDHREDAREDWIDHRENLAEERGERAGDLSEQRTERLNNASEQRTERLNQAGEQRTQRAESAQQRAQNASPEQRAQAAERQQNRQTTRAEGGTRARNGSLEASGYSGGERATRERSGERSGAFSGYSSGRSERAASSRGSRSRGGGGGGRRR